MNFNRGRVVLWILLLLPSPLLSATVDVLAIEGFLQRPDASETVFPYVINLASLPATLDRTAVRHFDKLGDGLIYFVKVKVNGVIYYRLSMGNFESRRQAQQTMGNIKPYYPDAWIGIKSEFEQTLLKEEIVSVRESSEPKVEATVVEKPLSVTETEPVKRVVSSLAEKLSRQAKEEFLNEDYTRVIKISDKLMEIGDISQQQKAMELAGLARERQRKFAQAIAIYKQFLELYPNSDLQPRITARLQGLQTMNLSPRQRLAEKKTVVVETEPKWDLRGGLSQYYRNDLIDRGELDNEDVNKALVTDIDLYARRKTDGSTLTIRFDGGVVHDQIDEETDSRISRALVSYTDIDYGFAITGGRQSRTAKGVYGRFDGFVYEGLSHPDINYGLHTGYLVDSSFDKLNSDRRFLGGSINFEPYNFLEVDIYLLHQEVFNLTDRQAIGTEFQFRGDKGFFYGIVDYDIFYENLNNITAITNYRYSDSWTVNLTIDYRNSPLLTTTNAIQGQGVDTVDELTQLFSDEEIYDLAEERTSKSQNLFAGVSYQIDDVRQLYISLSYTSVEAAEASAGVPEIPASDDIHISTEYSIRGFFFSDDFSSFGVRVSDTSSAETVSIRGRTRFPGPGDIRYDPRIRFDYRKSQNSDVQQWILSPSIRLTYQYGRSTSFEGSLGIEYSNFDLPELDNQTVYALFLGYVYQF